MKVHQSLARDCLRAMQYNIETRVFHGGSVRAVGTGYHKGLELHYVARRDGIVLPSTQECVDAAIAEFDAVSSGAPSHSSEHEREPGSFKWNERVPDRATAHEKIETMVRAYFDGKHFWPLDYQVLGVECSFDEPWFADNRRGGQIDLVLLEPNDWVMVDDQKTGSKNRWPKGKEHPRKNLQSPWYYHAARNLFPDHAGYRFCFSIMLHNGTFERREATPTDEHIRAAEDVLGQTVSLYKLAKANDLDLPANPSSNLCSAEWCDWFDDVCPHGRRLESL